MIQNYFQSNGRFHYEIDGKTLMSEMHKKYVQRIST